MMMMMMMCSLWTRCPQ